MRRIGLLWILVALVSSGFLREVSAEVALEYIGLGRSQELGRFVIESLGFAFCVDAIVESETWATLGELLPIA